MPRSSEELDPLQQPWQERLLIFVLLCVMVLYLARVVLRFRGQGLTIHRGSDEGDQPVGENEAIAEDVHSD